MLLFFYIEEQLEKNNDMRSISFDEKHLPDVDWCLKALSALDPLHMIFDPDYKPPSNHRGRRGIRYVPTAEDLYNLDESFKKSNESDIVVGAVFGWWRVGETMLVGANMC